MHNYLAQVKQVPIGTPITGIGEIGLENNPGGGVSIMARVISVTIGFLTLIGAIYFMFVLITGAIGIIGAGGDKQALQIAQRKITMGIIGMVVTVAAMFVMDLIANIIGIPDILNFGAMIQRIRL
ncbi:hypothetical protein A2863_02830 [Candidatus Woesebacteria bacterium RIFCSPHIGHO2_01_FULL_38_9b]|uniref:Uncharacterized protein n=1 Tax=Candidatus Woesebacteria bacterium RIFCSPHIGHO2_01_FULL_38_9b TaxID=1802493 RepID=A0A1F7Y2W0_9BACT|nr:MAG: hypothetical protein A2863_02830 [Candidatus Woesebacteria bacterium RIFCSPHIGHO2_01_FULL_38_9b]